MDGSDVQERLSDVLGPAPDAPESDDEAFEQVRERVQALISAARTLSDTCADLADALRPAVHDDPLVAGFGRLRAERTAALLDEAASAARGTLGLLHSAYGALDKGPRLGPPAPRSGATTWPEAFVEVPPRAFTVDDEAGTALDLRQAARTAPAVEALDDATDPHGIPAATAADAPVADAPVPDALVADVRVADAPFGDAPFGDASVADEPVVDASVADEPVLDAPVLDAPVADSSVSDAPVLDEPVTVAPVADEPVLGEPVVVAPVADEPLLDEPTAVAPVADEPLLDEPTAVAPVADEPLLDEPTAVAPVADEPVLDEPVADAAVALEPVVDKPAEVESELGLGAPPDEPAPAEENDDLEGLRGWASPPRAAQREPEITAEVAAAAPEAVAGPEITAEVQGEEPEAPEPEAIAAVEPTDEPVTETPMTAEPETAESRTAEPGTAESRTAESRVTESGTAESRVAESRTAEPGTAESRVAESGTAESHLVAVAPEPPRADPTPEHAAPEPPEVTEPTPEPTIAENAEDAVDDPETLDGEGLRSWATFTPRPAPAEPPAADSPVSIGAHTRLDAIEDLDADEPEDEDDTHTPDDVDGEGLRSWAGPAQSAAALAGWMVVDPDDADDPGRPIQERTVAAAQVRPPDVLTVGLDDPDGPGWHGGAGWHGDTVSAEPRSLSLVPPVLDDPANDDPWAAEPTDWSSSDDLSGAAAFARPDRPVWAAEPSSGGSAAGDGIAVFPIAAPGAPAPETGPPDSELDHPAPDPRQPAPDVRRSIADVRAPAPDVRTPGPDVRPAADVRPADLVRPADEVRAAAEFRMPAQFRPPAHEVLLEEPAAATISRQVEAARRHLQAALVVANGPSAPKLGALLTAVEQVLTAVTDLARETRGLLESGLADRTFPGEARFLCSPPWDGVTLVGRDPYGDDGATPAGLAKLLRALGYEAHSATSTGGVTGVQIRAGRYAMQVALVEPAGGGRQRWSGALEWVDSTGANRTWAETLGPAELEDEELARRVDELLRRSIGSV